MKAILGLLLCLVGIALGLYVGVWLCFIGGIVQGVAAVQAHPLNGLGLAIGLARVMGSGLAGWLAATACLGPGLFLIGAWADFK